MTVAPFPDPLPSIGEPDSRVGDMLKERRGLVVGIAIESSIAYGCAAKLRVFGAGLAVTWLNDKAERFVRPLAEGLRADIANAGDCRAVRLCPVMMGKKELPHGPTQIASDPR